MYNPEKDFGQLIVDCLGKDGKSISALSKDLEERGFKIHRLIITGYLRALTDQGILKEREIPPSKIYQPVKSLPDSIYETVGKACRRATPDADELVLYMLYRLFKRPIFVSELRAAGVTRPIGKDANEHDVTESRKVLRRSGNVVPSQAAVYPVKEFQEKYADILADMALDVKDAKHLVMETKQTKLV
jgi:hypothetical protein